MTCINSPFSNLKTFLETKHYLLFGCFEGIIITTKDFKIVKEIKSIKVWPIKMIEIQSNLIIISFAYSQF